MREWQMWQRGQYARARICVYWSVKLGQEKNLSRVCARDMLRKTGEYVPASRARGRV